MFYELRHYVPADGKADLLLQRFEKSTVALFRDLGYQMLDFWVEDETGDIWYLMAWTDRAAMDTAWDAFRTNPAWLRPKRETEAAGPLVAELHSIPLRRPNWLVGG